MFGKNGQTMKNCFTPKGIVRIAIVLSLIVLSACNKDNELVSEHAYVNKWIYDNMNFWYYWNDRIPTKPNQNQVPDLFFKSLKVSEDRFSEIYPDYQEILRLMEGVGKDAGYEFILFRESEGTEGVIAQVLYIKPSSPASATPLKRGDFITHINGQLLHLRNYRELISQIGENHTITYRPLTVQNANSGTFGAYTTISMNTVVYEENPNYLTATFDLGERKAGYFVYNFFAPGISDGQQYNNQMDQIMASFKSQEITDLIVDLRYNGGGYASASLNLASLLGKNIDPTKTYYWREHNQKVIDYFKLTEADYTEKFLAKADNIGSSLTGNLYILTGTRTASASELVINGLRPFMNVILIGEKTLGKNVGSIPVYKNNDPKNRWMMLPTVAKSFNHNNQSEYNNGFMPDILVYEGVYLYPLGNINEPVLKAALSHISNSSGRIGLPKTEINYDLRLGTSWDYRHRGVRNLLIDTNGIIGCSLEDN